MDNQQLAPIEMFRRDLQKEGSRLKASLPAHLPLERFQRAAMIAVENNMELLACEPQSLMTSLSRCAQDGLVPDNREAAMVIFNTKSGNNWVKKAKYMPMVDGVLKRARQSGEISTITARAVYENDQFDYWIDEDGEHVQFRPNLHGDRGGFKLVFAMAKTKSGELIVEPMSKDEVEKVRMSSKNPDKGPWKDWYERMACKSVLHRLSRRLPNSSEIMEMLKHDHEGYNFNDREMKDVNSKPSRDTYTMDSFTAERNKLASMIDSGRQTAQSIIAMKSSKYDIPEDVRSEILSLEAETQA
jgi:recombination protein RecT